MKKLCLLLAFALALMTMPAYAAQGDMLLGRGEEGSTYFNYGFPLEDTFYLSTGSALYTYRLGEVEFQEHAIAAAQQESGVIEEYFPFAAGGELYAIGLGIHYEEDTSFEGAKLYRMLPGDENGYSLEEVASLDWGDLVEYYDQSSYPIRPEVIVGVGSSAFFRVYDANGDYQMYALDVGTGSIGHVDAVRDVYSLTPYRDDTLLVQSYSYDTPGETRLIAYDPNTESADLVATMEISDYSPLSALAYDFETDTLYCAQAGEIHPLDLQNAVLGEGVTDVPLEAYNSGPAYVLPGSNFVFCAEGMVVRNLDPEQRAETKLKINDSSWDDSISNAYYRFSNAHGDVSVVLSRDWAEAQNLLENMMNRDDSVDVYVLPSTSSIYDALYQRGYLMELDGSEKLSALAEEMYPDLREALSTDGRLVALPVCFYGWSIGVNEEPLEALGYTMDDVPDNWLDLLDFIAGLEQPLAEHPNIHLFYSGYTAREARNDLFNSLFEDYQRYANTVNPDAGYNTPLLRALLTKLDEIDFVALGCAEDSEDDGEGDITAGMVTDDYSEDTVVFSTGIGSAFGSFYSSYTPLLLGLDAETPMPLVLRADLVFINPYTKNPDMALAYLEEVADNLTLATRYTMNPALNEPVRGAQNEQNVADAQQWVTDAQNALDEAEEADRQMLEDNLRSAQDNLDYWENYGWEVSQREIDWFRAHDDSIRLDRVNWLYADDTGDAWDLVNQYLDGAIGLDEMLTSIDRKAQMMRQEGN